MDFWMIYIIVAGIFITFEIFVPTMFCINFAFAAVITALISFFWANTAGLFGLFVVLSALSLIFIKPLLVKYLQKKDGKADFDGQYIGKIVKVIETVTPTSGAVTIYEERWEARLKQGETEEIPTGSDVKIVSNESTVLFVEKV